MVIATLSLRDLMDLPMNTPSQRAKSALACRAAAGALAVVMTALPIMLLSTAAQAGEQKIKVGNLSQASDVAAFNRGVERAAREICIYPLDTQHSVNVINCNEAVREEALDQLNAHQRAEVAAYDKAAVQVAGAPSSKH